MVVALIKPTLGERIFGIPEDQFSEQSIQAIGTFLRELELECQFLGDNERTNFLEI